MPPKDKDTAFAVDENEVEKEPSLYEWVVEKLEETFVNNIPLDSIRELPSFYMHALGVVSYMLMGFCLVYFSYKGELSGRSYIFSGYICFLRLQTVNHSEISLVTR